MQVQGRFIYAMNVYQQFVKTVQDMQIIESRVNKDQSSPMIRDFRSIEFKLRDFVESTLRDAVS